MMNKGFYTVIPARYGSSRLPGKPLLDIAGKPMIQHVHERATEAGAKDVVVATDDQRIIDVVSSFGGKAVMTSQDHESGMDRLAEVVDIMGWADNEIIVNLQGDEPLMDPALLRLVANNLEKHKEAGITTLATPIKEREELFNPNVVKVVSDKSGKAMYFSRAPIPWVRGDYEQAERIELPTTIQPHRHLGIYAYRISALKKMTSCSPCDIEIAESLEQLRALWNGIGIHVGVIEGELGHGVDTDEDYQRVCSVLG
jgi:3-deoxy-manno-octulosonate cytidylyltransferase (CMP-KDO synthetase)